MSSTTGSDTMASTGVLSSSSVATCDVQSMKTPYNENDAVPTYTGIMFEVFAHTDLEILTIEFDARYNDIATTDLSVQVYTKQDDYMPYVNNMAVWTRISESVAIPVSTKSNLGVIIPFRQFKPITIPANTKQSIYITMMSGSYIDFNVDALQKAGEIMQRSNDIDIFVGSGFSDTLFPVAGVNRTVNPMFSGVLHYKKSSNCASNTTAATPSSDKTDDNSVVWSMIDFPFLVNTLSITDEIQNVIQKAIDSTLDALFSEEGSTLRQYQEQYRLQHYANETAVHLLDYSGACSSEWQQCPTQYAVATAKVANVKALDTGYVKYEIYKQINEIIGATADAIAALPTEAGKPMAISYLGYEAISANYTVNLVGVEGDGTSTLTDEQADYFADVTTSFLNELMMENSAYVFVTTVSPQDETEGPNRRLRQRQVQSVGDSPSMIQISGTIFGAQSVAMTPENYQFSLDDAFSLGANNFQKKLQMASLLPETAMADSSAVDYFYNARIKAGVITSIFEPSPISHPNNVVGGSNTGGSPSDNGSGGIAMATVLILVGVGIAAIVVSLLIYQLVKNHMVKKKREKEREARRARANKSNEDDIINFAKPPQNRQRGNSVPPRNKSGKNETRPEIKRSLSSDCCTDAVSRARGNSRMHRQRSFDTLETAESLDSSSTDSPKRNPPSLTRSNSRRSETRRSPTSDSDSSTKPKSSGNLAEYLEKNNARRNHEIRSGPPIVSGNTSYDDGIRITPVVDPENPVAPPKRIARDGRPLPNRSLSADCLDVPVTRKKKLNEYSRATSDIQGSKQKGAEDAPTGRRSPRSAATARTSSSRSLDGLPLRRNPESSKSKVTRDSSQRSLKKKPSLIDLMNQKPPSSRNLQKH